MGSPLRRADELRVAAYCEFKQCRDIFCSQYRHYRVKELQNFGGRFIKIMENQQSPPGPVAIGVGFDVRSCPLNTGLPVVHQPAAQVSLRPDV